MTRLLLLLALASVIVAASLIFSGPHMRDQPSLRAYEEEMPLPPEGSVPVTPRPPWPPPAGVDATDPIPGGVGAAARGRVYYGYYCAACHGADAAGDGPVSRTFVPRPPDLRTSRVRALSDLDLLRAMLLGVGHEPVLRKAIAHDHAWAIVRYLQALDDGSS
jgi:mono/diheme cytochrome c family protein